MSQATRVLSALVLGLPGNVTMDLAATRIISVRNDPVPESEGDALLKS